MNPHRRTCLLALSLALAAGPAVAQTFDDETPAQHATRMAWWREAKFGLFIHWGVYAVPAGQYRGQPVSGIGEWIMLRARIPVTEYRAFAGEFNPVHYDPTAWVAAARDAGMRYLVITSKHHDGFALYDSAVTDWDVAEATPYRRDLLAPLAEATRAAGLKFGLYYSHAQDWVHPGGAKMRMDDGDGWDEAHKGSFDRYLDQIAVPQTREILTRYRPDILWWDTPHLMTPERASRFRPLLAETPSIITNNRLGGGFRGDTDTPEQHIPATGIPGRDWETCMTMNGTWGYKSDDHNWKSTTVLVRNLIDIVSKGGNYLLNVGPTADGTIPQPSLDRLREVGAWMRVNGQAIYGTTASPFQRLPWGRCTRSTNGAETTLYLHVFDWPGDGRLRVPGLTGQVTAAWLLADPGRQRLPVASEGGDLVVTLPATAPDPISSTVALSLAGDYTVEPPYLTSDASGNFKLAASAAQIHGSKLKYEEGSGKDNLGYWVDPLDWAEWPVQVTAPGRYAVLAEVATETGGAQLAFAVEDGRPALLTTPRTGSYTTFELVPVGVVTVAAAGRVWLSAKPLADGWRPVNLKAVILIPIPD